MVACIDNLVKGAAGQAIQNFNVAFGFDEADGAQLTMATVLKLGGELLEDAAADPRRGRGHRPAGRTTSRWSSCTAAAGRSTPS